MDMLRNCVTLRALRNSLSSLPKTLDETYERILTNIDESFISDVQRILQFLTFSIRPMRLSEMVEVLAIDWDADEPYFDTQNRIPDPKDILTMCSTLVTASETRRVYNFFDEGAKFALDPTLRLAHFSVKEYLISERIKASKASIYSMNPTSSHIFIATTYLTYLMSPAFESGYQRPWTLTKYKECPLFQTAQDYWPKHINAARLDLPESTKNLIRRFFDTRHKLNGGQYAVWVGSLIPDSSVTTILNTPPLYYAASFGMTTVVQALLATTPKSEIDIKGGRGISTPLHVACYRQHLPIVKLLLEAGADPNSFNKNMESCFFWANSDIRCLLQQYGANQKLELVTFGRPISISLRTRDELRMMRLLKTDAEDGGGADDDAECLELAVDFQRIEDFPTPRRTEVSGQEEEERSGRQEEISGWHTVEYMQDAMHMEMGG
jgi:hypothetical protein